MKVLIVSDTHRSDGNYWTALRKTGAVDMIVHCGDVEGSEIIMREKASCPIHIVSGNNDFFADLPKEEEFMMGKYHVWLTHGHYYHVSMGNEILKEEARSRGVDIVMYGHTHRPVVEIEKGLIALNPGSLTYPRQEGKTPSYVVADLDRNGDVHFKICHI